MPTPEDQPMYEDDGADDEDGISIGAVLTGMAGLIVSMMVLGLGAGLAYNVFRWVTG